MSFTVIMLGTDTLFTPEPEKFPKVDYPRGETLSVVSTLIVGEAVRDDKAISPYVSTQVEVIIGSGTTGTDVGDRIKRGILAILKALARGDMVLNIVGHSRGAVEAILIAHELDSIQTHYRNAELTGQPEPNLLDVLAILASDELSNPKGNTGKIQQHLVKMSGLKDIGKLFNHSIKSAQINLFIIDPVPGDDPLYGWVDSRYCQIPEIVADCEVYLYENERTRFFTPLQLLPSPNREARFSVMSMPGHHGSGSSGNNRDQATLLVPASKGNASHIQSLMFFKIMAFLGRHGVAFKKPEEWVVDAASLLRTVLDELEKLDKRNSSDQPWHEELVLPICFKLYSDILQNIEAYQHFNATNYHKLGQAATYRYILTQEKIYKKFSDILPPVQGYVNAEHASIVEKILSKLLGLNDISDKLALHSVVAQAADTLFNGLQAYYLAKENSSWLRNNPVALLLMNAEGKKQVIDNFSVLVDRISQIYLRNHLASEEKVSLFASVQKIFLTFKRLAEELENDPQVGQEKPLQEFIHTILLRVKQGISNTLMRQYYGLQDEVAHLYERSNSKAVEKQYPGQGAPLSRNNFKQIGRRLHDFRSSFEIFRQFELDITFSDMETHLEEMGWCLMHRAADFVAGKEQSPQKIDWDKFDHYIDGLAVLHETNEPSRMKISFIDERHLDERRLHAEQLTAMQQKLEQAQALANEQKKQMEILVSGVNSNLETKYLSLIRLKLKPLTEDYLSHLQARQPDDGVCDKMAIIETLIICLTDTSVHLLPSKRVETFYTQLGGADEIIHAQRLHHDEPWKRYVKNTIFVAGIVLTGVSPALAYYTAFSDIKSLKFWQSHDETVVEELQEHKETVAMIL